MMHGEESDAIWLKERRKEFEDVIDLDHDGKVGIEELKVIIYESYISSKLLLLVAERQQ